jgi:hypothetical protein
VRTSWQVLLISASLLGIACLHAYLGCVHPAHCSKGIVSIGAEIFLSHFVTDDVASVQTAFREARELVPGQALLSTSSTQMLTFPPLSASVLLLFTPVSSSRLLSQARCTRARYCPCLGDGPQRCSEAVLPAMKIDNCY